MLGEDAADDLMNMSPFQMKSLLYFILSGKEFKVEQGKKHLAKLYFMKVFE